MSFYLQIELNNPAGDAIRIQEAIKQLFQHPSINKVQNTVIDNISIEELCSKPIRCKISVSDTITRECEIT